jgi:hypothetical protein
MMLGLEKIYTELISRSLLWFVLVHSSHHFMWGGGGEFIILKSGLSCRKKYVL